MSLALRHAAPLPAARPAQLVASVLAPDIARKSWSIRPDWQQASCHVYFVGHGQAVFDADQSLTLVAPCLLWLPKGTEGMFHLEAGSDGFAAVIPVDLIRRVTADSPMAGHLRPLLDQTLLLSGARVHPIAAEIGMDLLVLARETRQPRLGSMAMIAAHLNLLLLHLLRGSGDGATANLRGTRTTTAQRFHHLVEIHYREPVGIDDYAALLGVTRAHLHVACKRAFYRTPLQLVNDCLIREAQARLETTELPIGQIAFSLGFQDAGYFSRFFRRLTGVTPEAFRSSRVTSANRRSNGISFADWP